MPPNIRTKPAHDEPSLEARSLAGRWKYFSSLPMLKCTSDSCLSQASESSQQEVCLSPLSQYFLNVEQPPDIYAIMTLEGCCSLQELVQPMQHMAELHDRFRRRVVYRFGAWKAEMLEDFDVTTLMREVTLDGPDAQLAFDDYMGQLMTSEPLGVDGLPPWDVLCIHYSSNPNRTDVLMRASHIIGDGQLFMKLIKQIMEPQDAAAVADYAATVLAGDLSASRGDVCKVPAAAAEDELASSSGGSSSAGGSSCSDSDSDTGSAISQQPSDTSCSSSSIVSKRTAAGSRGNQHQHQLPEQQQQQHHRLRQQRSVRQRLGRFLHLLWRLITMCWHGYTALLFTAWQPFWFSDPVTAIKAAPAECRGPRKWSSHTLRLSEFHQTAKRLGHSINTLAVSCLAGGIRRYLLKHSAPPANRVRLCSMVDTRSMPGLLTGTDGNSNNFSFIGVPLFTGSCSPLERVGRVGWALSWIRHSLAVPLAIRMPSIIQFLFRDPAWSSWAILRCLPSKTTIGFSNMRGPAGKWSLVGYPVVRIHNGVQPNAFGCFVSLFSYSDCLTFTHTCYTSKSSQPQVLVACIIEEYDALRKAAAVSGADAVRASEPGSPASDKIKAA